MPSERRTEAQHAHDQEDQEQSHRSYKDRHTSPLLPLEKTTTWPPVTLLGMSAARLWTQNLKSKLSVQYKLPLQHLAPLRPSGRGGASVFFG
jgi:hypothetical protein